MVQWLGLYASVAKLQQICSLYNAPDSGGQLCVKSLHAVVWCGWMRPREIENAHFIGVHIPLNK